MPKGKLAQTVLCGSLTETHTEKSIKQVQPCLNIMVFASQCLDGVGPLFQHLMQPRDLVNLR